MTEPALALRHENKSKEDTVDNPFASPAMSTASPYAPSPIAYPPQGRRSSRDVASSSYTHTGHDRWEQQVAPHKARKAGSTSSAADSAVMTPVSSLYLEKANAPNERQSRHGSRESQRGRQEAVGDPEKAMYTNDTRRSSNNVIATSQTYEEDDGYDTEEGRQIQEQKSVKILLFLSGTCVLLSFLNMMWALVAILVTTLSQPIRLCAKRPSFGSQLAGLLGPTLNLQLRSIHTPLPPHASEDTSYRSGMLLLVHMLSPILSLVVMFAAWILAVYWLVSAAVGDPAGQDKRDDGMETVLGLRNWWERWLKKSFKAQ